MNRELTHRNQGKPSSGRQPTLLACNITNERVRFSPSKKGRWGADQKKKWNGTPRPCYIPTEAQCKWPADARPWSGKAHGGRRKKASAVGGSRTSMQTMCTKWNSTFTNVWNRGKFTLCPLSSGWWNWLRRLFRTQPDIDRAGYNLNELGYFDLEKPSTTRRKHTKTHGHTARIRENSSWIAFLTRGKESVGKWGEKKHATSREYFV